VQLVLASASPARLGVLRAAGLSPRVEVSQVDEEALLARLPPAPCEQRVCALALAKAEAVGRRIASAQTAHAAHGDDRAPAVIVGCDSMLWVDNELVGKPGTPEVARQRWTAMAGGTGTLFTGHAVLLVRDGVVERSAVKHAATSVRFANPTARELEAYLASGEPLAVAGAFTLDGLGGWFVEGIDGDPSNVIGISLPLTRRLLAEVGVALTDLWPHRPHRTADNVRDKG